MNPLILILIFLIALFILYAVFKPYLIKYDSTIAFTGGLGSGKTLNAVKTGTRLYKKTVFTIKLRNSINKKLNKLIQKHNNKVTRKINKGKKRTGKLWTKRQIQKMPKFISNIPIVIGKKKGKKVFSTILTKEMLLLKEEIPEYSIVLIDELPQLINQYNWNIKEVQENVNEFITFFRHYIGGYFIVTAQADNDVVAQIRRKLNSYYMLMDFQKIFFKFYRCRIIQLMASDNIENVHYGFVEDNSRWIYGTLFTKKYDSRCYSERYKGFEDKEKYKFARYKTNKIIRFSKYQSPLDEKKEEK